MKAAVFEGVENIQVREIKKPECDSDGTIIKIMCCGLVSSNIENYYSGLRDSILKRIMSHEIAGILARYELERSYYLLRAFDNST